MYAQCSSMNLQLGELPMMSCDDGTVSCELPLSPGSQLMYESELVQDQCCVREAGQPEQSVLDTRVISPSVEGLTFNDYDVLSYVFARNDQQQQPAATSSDDIRTKYLSDGWTVSDSGPTLTQLNSDDLDAMLLDDFGVSSSGFCVDMSSLDCSQLIAVTSSVAIPSSTATLSVWSDQMRKQQEDIVKQHHQQQHQQVMMMSHVHSSPRVMRPTHTPATARSTMQLTVDRNWEAIESFLESEDERMAAEAASHQQQQIQLAAANVKSEAAESHGVVTDVDVDQRVNDATLSTVATVKADAHVSCVGNVTDRESSVDDNSCSDMTDLLTDTSCGSRKEKTYFWQYNTQSKGPKGKRLCRVVNDDDPYVLHDFEDPVFDTELLVSTAPCYRHSGKARRGDGNDVTPNPSRLYATGKELRKLARLINAICPAGELPTAVRTRSLREKNKYASRICRLKKKAQHEANKIKLYGLEQEHRQLTKVLTLIKQEICLRVKNPASSDGEKLTSKLDKLIRNHLTVMTGGHTTEYVSSVLAKVAAGDSSGGLAADD